MSGGPSGPVCRNCRNCRKGWGLERQSCTEGQNPSKSDGIRRKMENFWGKSIFKMPDLSIKSMDYVKVMADRESDKAVWPFINSLCKSVSYAPYLASPCSKVCCKLCSKVDPSHGRRRRVRFGTLPENKIDHVRLIVSSRRVSNLV